MFSSLFRSVGIVFLIAIFIGVSLVSIYLVYILSIGVVIFGSIFIIYKILQSLRGG